jgi:hypothetical protein
MVKATQDVLFYEKLVCATQILILSKNEVILMLAVF